MGGTTMCSAKPSWLLVSCLLVQLFTVSCVVFASSAAHQFLIKADNYLKRGNIIGAKNIIEQARELFGASPELDEFEFKLKAMIAKESEKRLNTGRFLLAENNLEEAKREFDRVLLLNSQNEEAAEALKKIAQIKQQVEKYHDNNIRLPKAFGNKYDLNAYSAFSNFTRAKYAFDEGRFHEAKQLLDEINERNENYPGIGELSAKVENFINIMEMIDEAGQNLDSGKFLNAVIKLDKAIDEFPDRSDLYLARAEALIGCKNYDKAMDDLKYVLLLNVSPEKVLMLLFRLYYESGDYIKAYAVSRLLPDSRYNSFNFRIKCYFKAYPISCFVLFILLLACLTASFLALDQTVKLFGEIRLGVFFSIILCLVQCYKNGTLGLHEKIKKIAAQTKTSWFFYLSGLSMMEIGMMDEALRSLQFCTDTPGISYKAYFFMGVIRKSFDQPLAEYDFDRAISQAIQFRPHSWTPGFLQRLELNIIGNSYQLIKGATGLEPIAFELFEKIVRSE